MIAVERLATMRNLIRVENLIREFGLIDGMRILFSKILSRRNKNKTTLVRMHCLEYPIHLRMGDSDWGVFEQVFINKEYNDPSNAHKEQVVKLYSRYIADGDVPVIIDCGANIGLSTIWYARAFPKAIIIAIEPEPKNFALLTKNTCNYKNVIPINAGISSSRGRMDIFNDARYSWASQAKENPEGKLELITIYDALNRIDFGKFLIVKVDIEGFEDKLFQSNTDWVASTPLLVAETHDWLFPWRGTAHAINSIVTQIGVWDQIQKDENTFYYSHKILKP